MVRKFTKSKNTSIDDLAVMVARGFESMDKRFNSVDERFEAMDRRFDGVDERFERVEERLDKIDSRLDKLEDKTLVVYTAFEKNLKIKLVK